MQYPDLKQLRSVLTEYYSPSNLRMMCFDMGVDYEDLEGNNKSDKVISLIEHMQNRRRLDELVGAIRESRPFIQLKMLDDPPSITNKPLSIPYKPNVDKLIQGKKVLESAIKREIKVAKSALLLVLIRDPDSKGLRFLLDIEPDYMLQEKDVRTSRVFQFQYPVDQFGNLLPTDVEIVINAPDFSPPLQSKTVTVNPDSQHDEEFNRVEEFTLIPLISGELQIIVEIHQLLDGNRNKVGSKPMHTMSKDNPSLFAKHRVMSLMLHATGVETQMNDTPPKPVAENLSTSPEAKQEINNYYAPVYQGDGGNMENRIDNSRTTDSSISIGGDYVAGDKIGGDKIGGDKIVTSGNVTTGDTYTFSGTFNNTNINVNSTLSNVKQTIGALPRADEATKAYLQQLITKLDEALQQAPADKADEVEAVAQYAEEFVGTANSDKPNKVKMQISADGLKKAAENLAAIVPNVVQIAGAIVAGILGLG